MDIVCVSHNAPPLNDAEALCTARLLSALAELGANVRLIAAETASTLDKSIAAEILDSRVKVTYVKAPTGKAARLANMARSQFHGSHIEWLGVATEATGKILKEYKRPILLTRAFPMVSNLVGYYCRQDAAAWVAHFSDPYPPFEWQDHWYSRCARPIHRRWARRVIENADLVTTTCANATRYIEEKSGISFNNKVEVVSHLALPKLKSGGFRLDRKAGEFVIAHIGAMMSRRRPDLILPGVMLAMEKHPEIRFLQYGHVDEEVLKLCKGSSAFQRLDIRHVGNLSPRDAADLQQQVDVNVVVDTDLGLPYSPFILSKYPHSVCAGRKLLMLSTPDSEMARMTAKYNGGEFVPFSTPQAVGEAICRLYQNRNQAPDEAKAAAYQNEFSVEGIARPFLNRLQRLLEAKRG